MTNFNRDLLLIILVFGFTITFAMMRGVLYEELELSSAMMTGIDFLLLGMVIAFMVFIVLSIFSIEAPKSEEDEMVDDIKSAIKSARMKDAKSKLKEHLDSD